jgi:hypothetical protein
LPEISWAVGAVFGTTADSELDWARKLPHLLDETMLVLMERGFDAADFSARSGRPSSPARRCAGKACIGRGLDEAFVRVQARS